MKERNIVSLLISVVLAGQMMPCPVYAQTNNGSEQGSETKIEKTLPDNGLMGYYFKDKDFKELELMAPIKNSNLEFNKDGASDLLTESNSYVRAVRWMGRIIPSQDGEYTISSDKSDTLIQINAQEGGLNKVKVKMSKGKEYNIRIEMRTAVPEAIDKLVTPKLYWQLGENKELIPKNNLFLRDYSQIDDNDPFIPKDNLFNFEKKSNLTRANQDWEDEDIDTDNDNIPDAYEKNGYTIKDSIAVKWEDSFAEHGYKKYLSSYLSPNTAGDPYTDYQKASGSFDKAIKSEARDPLVAAYPVVGVGMERLIISTNEHASSDQGVSVSRSTTNSKTEANTIGVAVSVGYSNGFTGSITTNYSHTSDNTTAVQNSNGESWNTALSINKGESAFVNANVRYYNTGTAPMYKVTPTTNLVLDGETLTTIKAQENQIGNNLSPNETYPKKGLSPLALNTMDQFSSRLIPINYDQLKKLDSGKQIKLETTQVSGNYGIKNSQGQIITDGNSWSDYISQIDSLSAAIILDTGTEVYERRVTAKDSSDPEDKTPVLTIGEAIEKAFGATKKNGMLYFNDMPIDENCVELIFDNNTANLIKERLKISSSKKIYDIQLERGMNILIKKPLFFNDFDQHNNFPVTWSNVNKENQDGLEGAANKFSGETKITIPVSNLNPYKRYIFSGYIKGMSASQATLKVKAKDEKSNQISVTTNYQKFSCSFETTGKEQEDIVITLNSTAQIYIDNLAITELNSTPEILKEPEVIVPSNQEILEAHSKYSADFSFDMSAGNVYLNGLYFEPTETNKKALDYIQKYRVEATLEHSGFKDIGTKDKESRNYMGDVNQPKTNYINLKSYYTSGDKVLPYKKLKIYAVTPDNKEILVLDAK